MRMVNLVEATALPDHRKDGEPGGNKMKGCYVDWRGERYRHLMALKVIRDEGQDEKLGIGLDVLRNLMATGLVDTIGGPEHMELTDGGQAFLLAMERQEAAK